MQSLRSIESHERHWARDAGVIFAWMLSLLVFSVFRTPDWFSWSGAAFLILYASWCCPFLKTAFLFLICSWLFSSFSLTPSGLFWLSLMIVYLVVYILQFRFMIRNAAQFMLIVALITWGFEFLQLFLVSQVYPGHTMSWGLVGAVVISGLAHAAVALMIYPSVQRWVVN